MILGLYWEHWGHTGSILGGIGAILGALGPYWEALGHTGGHWAILGGTVTGTGMQ